jgi:ribosomal protein S18 acetylase RimI-like enzyme
MEFRSVAAAEIEAAHAAYLGVFAWLKAKGVRQWLWAIPLGDFQERQRANELFAGHLEGELAAVVTLAWERSPYWVETLGDEKRWWIKTLAVARKWRGRGAGSQVLEECETRVRNAGAQQVFIDCVDVGFLPAYYERLGYAVVHRKDITYPSGNTFPVVLMKKSPARPA